MFNSLDTSVSSLVAHRVWMDTIQANVANVNTTRDADGNPNPYKRRHPVFTVDPHHDRMGVRGGRSRNGGLGVAVSGIVEEDGYRLVKDPSHPDAIKDGPQKGYVRMPNVDWYQEMANAMVAARAYEANITALQVSKQMYMSDLRLLG